MTKTKAPWLPYMYHRHCLHDGINKSQQMHWPFSAQLGFPRRNCPHRFYYHLLQGLTPWNEKHEVSSLESEPKIIEHWRDGTSLELAPVLAPSSCHLRCRTTFCSLWSRCHQVMWLHNVLQCTCTYLQSCHWPASLASPRARATHSARPPASEVPPALPEAPTP